MQSDLEDLFKKHGQIVRIELHGQFTFVQYEKLEMATRALKALNGYEFKDRKLIVEYTIRKDQGPRQNSRYSSHRMGDHHGARGVYGRQSYPQAYGSHGSYNGYNRGGVYGGPPPYSNGSPYGGGGSTYPGRHERRGYPGGGRYGNTRMGRRDDGYGWSAALSDRRSKRPLSPHRSLSPRRGDGEMSGTRKDRHSRSRSRSRSRSHSPLRERDRSRHSRSSSPSPKTRASPRVDSEEDEGNRSKSHRTRSRSRSRSRSPAEGRKNGSEKCDRSSSRSQSESRRRSTSPPQSRLSDGKSPSPKIDSPIRDHRKRSRSISPSSRRSVSPSHSKRMRLNGSDS